MPDVYVSAIPLKFIKSIPTQVMDWGLKATNISDAWKSTRGEGVKIGVIDTGIIIHSDLKNNIKGGINFTSNDSKNFKDRVGHGTHAAGIIAAEDNDFGIVGVAPKSSIYAVKSIGDNGAGEFENISKGIHWCIENGMDIISMSLGSKYPDAGMYEAIKTAYMKNIVIVAAAGNDGDVHYNSNNMDFPGRYPEVIAVGSINKYFQRSWFSSDGEELSVMAPGEEIYSTYLDDGYAILSGTSMATPFAVGVIALLIAKHRQNKRNKTPIDTPEQVREHLIRNISSVGNLGKDKFYGYGIISPSRTLEDLEKERRI